MLETAAEYNGQRLKSTLGVRIMVIFGCSIARPIARARTLEAVEWSSTPSQAVCYGEIFAEEMNGRFRDLPLFGSNSEVIPTMVINGVAELVGQCMTINHGTQRRFHQGPYHP